MREYRLIVAQEIEAVSEAAARQAWIDGDCDSEVLVEVIELVPCPHEVWVVDDRSSGRWECSDCGELVEVGGDRVRHGSGYRWGTLPMWPGVPSMRAECEALGWEVEPVDVDGVVTGVARRVDGDVVVVVTGDDEGPGWLVCGYRSGDWDAGAEPVSSEVVWSVNLAGGVHRAVTAVRVALDEG